MHVIHLKCTTASGIFVVYSLGLNKHFNTRLNIIKSNIAHTAVNCDHSSADRVNYIGLKWNFIETVMVILILHDMDTNCNQYANTWVIITCIYYT